ncbi:uncharacterized protein VICG_00427 [Vittaforma corneae ATCC 50505]|uniref:Uncharacterized protein n=1 Tax=Vittaforma corneae (strain ATCC 50505) TaxID=993615 RepID=L2GQA9_VITCO|nr:uncharacterized protein VICG_00427 [Vittaforma corneae ATCC 50505]ELA42675.1 hypothetical protein VICG_00427 [Vittaforma corneae ATCC 50505]
MSKDLSLSFLNTDSSIQSKQSASTDNQRSNAFRELFDPVFVNLRVMIPRKIEKIFKGVDRIDFMYDFIDSNYIEIVEMQSGNTFFRIFTCDYEHFPFKDKNELTNELEAVNGTATNRMGIVFVFGGKSSETHAKWSKTGNTRNQS